MKYFYIIIFGFFSFLTSSKAQFGCDFITLWSQEEVDSFPKKYNYCNKFYSIEIDDRKGPVFNLDSLSDLIELSILDIKHVDSLASISGLYNLRKVGILNLIQNKYFPSFPILDTIGNLRHIFGYYPSDLSLYQNIKHISEGIQVGLNGNLTGLPYFSCNKPFKLGVINNKIPNDVSNLIPQNYIEFEQVSLNSNNNLSLHGLDSVKIIHFVNINANKNCDFTALHHLEKVNRFSLGGQNMYDVQLGVLSKIKKIKFLELYELENIKTIDQLFPFLEEITTHVSLNGNKHLTNIDLLKNFNIPLDFPLYQGINYRIKIIDNPNLSDCANDYICRALQVYPDSVTLTGNGFNCEKEDLLSSCINSDSSEENDLDILLYPNPVIDKIYWDASHDVETFDIFDIQGRHIVSLEEKRPFMDISEFPPGMYVCKMKVAGKVVVRKIVKE